MSVQAESICSLSSDIFYNILRCLDGVTLASAACTCSTFSSISKEEGMWENVCNSLWPSTNRDDVRNLLKSVGGFRKFYADCYPLIVNKNLALVPLDSFLEYLEEWPEADYYEDSDEYDSITPSDFVSLVDITYNNKSIFSEVLWGISESDNLGRWFYNSPFHIDLGNSKVNDDAKKVVISLEDGLPSIKSVDSERKEGKICAELHDKLKLSWIIVNRKVNQAANLSSFIPLGVQRHWPEDNDFLVRFGSVLPADYALPCQVVECILLVKLRMFDDAVSACVNLELTQVSMQLEDMEGYHLNGRNSLMVLKKALNSTKSRNYNKVLELCNLYSRIRSEIKEEKMRNESRIEKMCILSGIVAAVIFWFFFL